jgi:hypothetical protein
MTAKLCLTLAVAWAAGLAYAEPIKLPATKLATPPTIDGTVNTDEWKEAAAFSGLVDSERREPEPEKSEFWLAFDDNYIYFAARLEDKEPDKVTATERQTNASFERDDTVSLTIGLGGYHGSHDYFQFNAIGTPALTLSGGSAAKLEWQGEFESAAHKTPTGWEGEARISWQLLDLQRFVKGDVRFNVYRNIPRRSNGSYGYGRETATHPEDEPMWDGVVPPKARHDNTLHLLPYLYAGWDPDKGRLTNGGLDFKTELAGGIGIAGTINPDFRNIEQSVLPLSFSRFELLADETRPFFLEGSGYFFSQLFASQRIGDFDMGLNVHGALNSRSSFALLNTFDFGRNRSTFGQASYRITPEIATSVAFTSLETSDVRNEAMSGDFSYSKGAYYISSSFSQSNDREDGQGSQWNSSGGYFDERFSFGLDYQSVTKNYNPALGYAPETDFKGPSLFAFYNQPLAKGPIERWSVSSNLSSLTRQNGDFYSSSAGVGGSVSLRNGISFRTNVYQSRFLDDHDHSTSFSLSYPTFVSPLSFGVSTSTGEFAGLPYRSYNGSVSYLIGSKYSLSLSHQIQEYQGRRDQTVMGISAKLAIDQELGFRFIERPSSTNWYLTYRKSGGKGAEYFVIFGDPSASEFRSSLVIKGIFPIEIR